MTCIVALRDKNGVVWMGGDSGSYSGYEYTTLPSGKVYQQGEFMLGFSGATRGANLVRYAFKPPEIEEDIDLMGYMVTQFTEELRKCFKEKAFSQSKEGQEKLEDGYLLVSVRGRIFIIWSDFCVDEDVRAYTAIGAGYAFAKGALSVIEQLGLDRKLPPKQIVETALMAAEEHSKYVRGPFTVISSSVKPMLAKNTNGKVHIADEELVHA